MIDGVVVNQSSCMEKLDPRASGYQAVSIVPIGSPGEEQDERAQPLPTGADQAKYEIRHAWIVNSDGFFQPRLHQKQFRSHGGKNVARPDINHRSLRTDRTPDLIHEARPVPSSGL
jgi:hypothetical protein